MAVSSPVANATIAAHTPFSCKQEIVRRDAKFHPSMWGDYFIKYLDQSHTEVVLIRFIFQIENSAYTQLILSLVYIYGHAAPYINAAKDGDTQRSAISIFAEY